MNKLLQIIRWPDKTLLAKTEPVKNIDGGIAELSKAMIEAMYGAKGMGLAANQVGEPLRLFVGNFTKPEGELDIRVIVNPEIVSVEGEEVMEEGCLSIPGFRADVPRYLRVLVRGFDLNQKPVEFEEEGLYARLLQHEIDHLEGKLFPDRLSRLKKNFLYQKVRKAIKKGVYGVPDEESP